MENLVILGTGPAGCTAAIYAARAGFAPLLLAGPLPGGLLTQTPKIENYPGFPEPVSGFDLTDAMMHQAEKLGARVQFHSVRALQLDCDPKTLVLDDGTELQSKAVIIATGAKHRQAENRGRIHGRNVSTCATCDGPFYRGKTVALVGNGSAALNEALYLCSLVGTLHLILPSDSMRGPAVLRERLEQCANLVVHPQCRLLETRNNAADEVESVVLKELLTGKEVILGVQGLFLALGFDPDTALLKGTGITLDDAGYIKRPDPETSLTNLPGVFAAGDCTSPLYKQAVIAAGAGAKAGIDAAEFLMRHA